MPYVTQTTRYCLSHLTSEIDSTNITTAGELNYLITKLVHSFLEIKKGTASYQDYNDALGALEGAKLELYRRQIASYEELKIAENGDV